MNLFYLYVHYFLWSSILEVNRNSKILKKVSAQLSQDFPLFQSVIDISLNTFYIWSPNDRDLK